MLIKRQGSYTQNLKRFILFHLSKGLHSSFFLIYLFIKVRMLIKKQGVHTKKSVRIVLKSRYFLLKCLIFTQNLTFFSAIFYFIFFIKWSSH